MSKGLRLSEKWFGRGLWLVSILFAGFLIALGSLVVADLPRVERSLSAEQFMDSSRLTTEQRAIHDDSHQLQDVQDASTRATLDLQHAQAATASARDSFNTWVATRSATEQGSQNPEVLQRTRTLDGLKATERQQELAVEALETRQNSLQQDQAAHERTLNSIRQAGEAGYNRAVRHMELRVFGLRMLLTLPLLLLAAWLFLHKRKSPRWPFVWGFIFFALYTFFVELVPYLPSYGGYLRYLVGLALTVWAGNYAISALRRYLDTQKAAEQRPEQERRKDLGYEAAQVRLARRICPACERPLDPSDPTNNFCMNCGLLVFEPCPRCATRQTTFSSFCRACGLGKRPAPPAEAPPPPPLSSGQPA